MCIICVDLGKSAMTTAEARRALGEMRVKLDDAHAKELDARLAADEEAPATSPPPSSP